MHWTLIVGVTGEKALMNGTVPKLINPSVFPFFLCLIFHILKNNMEEFFNENDSCLHMTFTDI